MNLLAASRLKGNHRAVQGLGLDLYLGLVLHQKHAPYQGRVFCSGFFAKRVLSLLLYVGLQKLQFLIPHYWMQFIVKTF